MDHWAENLVFIDLNKEIIRSSCIFVYKFMIQEEKGGDVPHQKGFIDTIGVEICPDLSKASGKV